MHRVMSSWCVQSQESSMVPFVGAVLDIARTPDQTALQTALLCVVRKLANGLYASFPYQTPQGQISPPNGLEPKSGQMLPITKTKNIPFPCSPIALSLSSPQAFASCTPARRTPARRTPARPNACTSYACTPAHSDSVQGTNRRSATRHKKHILQKNVGSAETVGNDLSGGASKPHRSKYMRLHDGFLFFCLLRRSLSWKVW